MFEEYYELFIYLNEKTKQPVKREITALVRWYDKFTVKGLTRKSRRGTHGTPPYSNGR